MSYLFVNERGANISFQENYVTVTYHDGMLRKIPVESLDAIYLFSYVQVTSQCVVECLKRGIPLSYFSKGGAYFGRLQSTNHVNVARQRQQAALANTEFALELAKKIIRGKIHNQDIVLRRYARSERKDMQNISVAIRQSLSKIDICKSINEIMGYEGNAARLYFDGLSQLVHPQFAFKGRSRRPPKDEFNSMLSFGYSLLMNEIYGKLENKGLNPYFGFVHSDRENHPTLASDLMEEWRATLIDSMVMSLVNGHEIHKEHFTNDVEMPGFYLTKDGLNIFIKKYDKKMKTDINYLSYVDYPTSFRRALDLQINQLAKAIEQENPELYTPIWLR